MNGMRRDILRVATDALGGRAALGLAVLLVVILH
jgi:hypothetical protein